MKISISMVAILLVVALTIAAAAYRVSTAPDRMRMRLNAAKATCVNGGGEWVRVGNEEACQAAVAKKV